MSEAVSAEEPLDHCECPQCGWIGTIFELKDHPTRPVAMDLGFCPECGGEIDVLMTKTEADELRASYED